MLTKQNMKDNEEMCIPPTHTFYIVPLLHCLTKKWEIVIGKREIFISAQHTLSMENMCIAH